MNPVHPCRPIFIGQRKWILQAFANTRKFWPFDTNKLNLLLFGRIRFFVLKAFLDTGVKRIVLRQTLEDLVHFFGGLFFWRFIFFINCFHCLSDLKHLFTKWTSSHKTEKPKLKDVIKTVPGTVVVSGAMGVGSTATDFRSYLFNWKFGFSNSKLLFISFKIFGCVAKILCRASSHSSIILSIFGTLVAVRCTIISFVTSNKSMTKRRSLRWRHCWRIWISWKKRLSSSFWLIYWIRTAKSFLSCWAESSCFLMKFRSYFIPFLTLSEQNWIQRGNDTGSKLDFYQSESINYN